MTRRQPAIQVSQKVTAALCGAAILVASLWGGSLYDRLPLLPGNGATLLPYGMPVAATLSGGALIAAWWPKMDRGKPQWWSAAIVALVFWASLSIVRSNELSTSINTLAILVSAVALGFAVARSGRIPGAIWGIALAAVAGAAIVSAMGLSEYVVNARKGDTSWRVFSTFTMPNFLAGYLVMSIPLGLGVFLAARERLFAGFAGLALLLDGACLLLTGSRFALVALVCAMATFGVLGWRAGALRGSSRKRAMILAVLALLAIVIGARPLLTRLKSGSAEAYSGQFRTLTWRGTLHMAAAHPILGAGIGSFPTAYAPFAEAGFTEHAHNSYLQLAAETGFVGLVFFAGGIIGVVLTGIRSVWRTPYGDAQAIEAHATALPEVTSHQPGRRRRRSKAPQIPEPENAAALAFDRRLLLAGVVAALLGAITRNIFDSDLYVGANACEFAVLAGSSLALAPNGESAISEASSKTWPFINGIAVRAVAVSVFAFLGVWGVRASLGRHAAQEAFESAFVQHDAPGSLDSWAQAIRYNGTNPDYWLGRAEVEAHSGQFDQAAQDYRHATEVAPIGKTFYRYGKFLVEQGDVAKAALQFEQALKVDPHFLPNLLALADAYRATGRQEDALKIYRELARDYNSPRGRLRALPELIPWEYAMAYCGLAEDALMANRGKEALKDLETGCTILGEFWARRHDARNQVREDVWKKVTQRYDWALNQRSNVLKELGKDSDSAQAADQLGQYRKELAEENRKRDEPG